MAKLDRLVTSWRPPEPRRTAQQMIDDAADCRAIAAECERIAIRARIKPNAYKHA